MTPSLRPDLASVAPYRAPQVEAPVRLNTNECPYPLPEGFAEELAAAIARIPFNRYPDREATALRKGLAEYADHPFAGVWAANGSNEVIQHLCLAYGGPGRAAMVFEPTYGLHSLIPRMIGMEVLSERLGADFRLGPEAVDAVRDRRPHVVFACSPNNPTGSHQPLSVIEAMCEAAGEGLVIVDEAYGEFGGVTAGDLVDGRRNLAVVRTFSKAFSLAAARLGYCLADPNVVEDLARVRLPYHLSALTQTAGEVALRYANEAMGILELVGAERDRLAESLGAMEAVEAVPSDANFVLFRTAAKAGALWRALLDRGVLVRDVSAAPGLERCLRVTAGTPQEVDAFLEAFPPALEETR
ncbi:MAG: histidinol-phosphate transaminase [Actinomycetota bacterium]